MRREVVTGTMKTVTDEELDDRTLLFTVLFDIRKDLRRIADVVGDDDEEAEEDEEDS